MAFGGVEKWKEAGRDTRALQWLDHISLDCKLGVRMLIKYPSLTLIGAFSMTVAIAIGATAFEVISQSLNARCRSRTAPRGLDRVRHRAGERAGESRRP